MAIIGNNTSGGGVTFDVNKSELANISELYTTVATTQNITDYYIWQHSVENNGKNAKVCVQDVTGGSANSVIVSGTEQSFIGDGSGQGWLHIDLSSNPITLPAGTYALQFWSDGWVGSITGGYTNNRNIRVENVTDLQSPFNVNAQSRNNNTVSAYIITEDASVVTEPVINDVNGGASIANGDTDITITGSGFFPAGQAPFVIISLTDDIDYLNADTQSVFGASDTSINFDVSLPPSFISGDPVYLFVRNSTPESNPVGFPVVITPDDGTKHTLVIVDESLTKSVVCQSPSGNFSDGVNAIKYPAGDTLNPEFSFSISAISTLPTSTPEFLVLFSSGPIDPFQGDEIAFVYDQTVGDIESVKGNKKFPSGTYPGTTCT